ncbi:MAG: PEP-utilizing enzyme [Acidimicrobiia bacterium]|nr:PEP-utilizing enzyme [Acidimicrobiia bacterium]
MTSPGGAAAIVAAVAAVEAGDLDRAAAVAAITAADIESALHAGVDSGAAQVLTTGIGASPGAAAGHICFTADDVLDTADRGERALLVCKETSPADEIGMRLAEGILTATGGMASHAAVVARGWGIPAVCGAEAMVFGGDHVTIGDVTLRAGDLLTIQGASGEVMLEAGEVSDDDDVPDQLEILLGWADEIRGERLGIRTNADTGPDAARAREFGAQGIGLCRTEHMFLGARLPLVQRMILATTEDEEAVALEALHRVQREDFVAVLEAMDGLPVTVRLLDPPLHEFLPDIRELVAGDALGTLTAEERALFDAARSWAEVNPMLGTRGVRLGVIKNGLYRMQVRALCDAAGDRIAAGGSPVLEIMIPLVVTGLELALVRRWVRSEVAAAEQRIGHTLDVRIGTMIETPRAALCAGDIAGEADFFSFGTNDLTQMVFGFSRDDVTTRVIAPYIERGLLVGDPFESLDIDGVGVLVEQGVRSGRAAKADLKIGVCGEHGGDPASIAFFVASGFDYVSCSPFRVPVARLAAAQAILAS